MAVDSNKGLVILGFGLLWHAAYSYRHYIKLAEAIDVSNLLNSIPVDVIAEIIFAFFFILYGSVKSLHLKPIYLSPNIPSKTYPEVISNSDFMIFNHRGIVIANR
eukprot:gene32223-43021_t